MTGWPLIQIRWCLVCCIWFIIDFLHMFVMLADVKMRSGLDHFFHLALLRGFSSLTWWMSVRSHEAANCLTAFCCRRVL